MGYWCQTRNLISKTRISSFESPLGWCRKLASQAQDDLKKTALYDLHLAKKGQMVGFAGWSLPVKYADLSLTESHHHTRTKASIFDVSHMLQTKWVGKDRVKFIEKLVVGDIFALEEGSATLSLFTNSKGGIIDDTVICRQEDHLYVVSNAACAETDLAHITTYLKQFQNQGGDVDVQVIDTHSLLALQGPKSSSILQEFIKDDLKTMNFMLSRTMLINGIECRVSRVGYTGEDGFEISVPHEHATKLCNLLLDNPEVKLAGLGARDSLRLEAGLCLYGHDLSEDISPIEGTLLWTIGKRRREEGGFLGYDAIKSQIENGVSKKRVGLIVQGAPAREGAKIMDSDKNEIGLVTSGCPSPTLKKNIAMGYVTKSHTKVGTQLNVQVRSRTYPAEVVKLPFVKANYFKVIKGASQ